jgi:hypothetical protein
VSCSKCGCGFCAVCLADCGRDAHFHTLQVMMAMMIRMMMMAMMMMLLLLLMSLLMMMMMMFACGVRGADTPRRPACRSTAASPTQTRRCSGRTRSGG